MVNTDVPQCRFIYGNVHLSCIIYMISRSMDFAETFPSAKNAWEVVEFVPNAEKSYFEQ